METNCTVEIKKETERAILVTDGTDDFGVWIPKSQISNHCTFEEGTTIDMEIPEWLAVERGFV